MTGSAETYDIYYDDNDAYVVMEWNDYSTSEQFRQGTEKMLQLLSEKKASKVLADIRNMLLIGQADQRWLETDFLPRAIREGFKKFAVISPRSYFNKVAIETISEKVDPEVLQIRILDSKEEAVEWLRN